MTDGPAYFPARPTFQSVTELMRLEEVRRGTPRHDGESALAYIRRLAIAGGLIPPHLLDAAEREPGQEG